MHKVGDFKFKTEWEAKRANYFRKAGSNVLFALAVDYPGLREIPLVYLDLARRELRKIGLRHYNVKLDGYVKNGLYNEFAHTPAYRIFYLGPRPNRNYYGTPKYMARSFKIHLYNTRYMIEEAN
jgi:hypothetical protein